MSHVKLKTDWKEYFYAQTNRVIKNKKVVQKSMLLHRYIMNATKDEVVDHIDFDTCNTRKSNLRKCSRKENSRHRRTQNNNLSGCNGVFRYNHHGYDKWQANIKVNMKKIVIGHFDNYDDAVKARQEAEKKYFGEYLPEDTSIENYNINT